MTPRPWTRWCASVAALLLTALSSTVHAVDETGDWTPWGTARRRTDGTLENSERFPWNGGGWSNKALFGEGAPWSSRCGHPDT